MTSLLVTALERAQGFLLAPAPAAVARPAAQIAVAVVGLRRGCGVSTVARGLEAALEAPVADLPHDEIGGSPCDATVLVSPGDGEPALATVAAGLLRARLGRVLVVANRVRDPGAWTGHANVCLPDSRLAAMLAGRGHLPPGELGEALARLAGMLAEELTAATDRRSP